MRSLPRVFGSFVLLLISLQAVAAPRSTDISVNDVNVVFSPYNWYRSGSAYAQSPNPGAYLKMGFTGTKVSVDLDVSPLVKAEVPAAQYPVVRYSVDGSPPTTVQLTPTTASLPVATVLKPGSHSLLLQYVAGYVFLDFWTPVNLLRVTGFTLDSGATAIAPMGAAAKHPSSALFLGDSITNGDDDKATFAGGITNAVDTQDATVGYPAVVASALRAEYGIVAYGGASWDRTAADGHTPGLMASYSMLDSLHSRLIAGKLSPVPNDVFINMGENAGPSGDDVPKLLAGLRAATVPTTNVFLIVPFSGRAREPLTSGFAAYRAATPSDVRTFLIDIGNNPYLTVAGPTMLSVDGQHPLAALHGLLGAQLVQARAQKLQHQTLNEKRMRFPARPRRMRLCAFGAESRISLGRPILANRLSVHDVS